MRKNVIRYIFKYSLFILIILCLFYFCACTKTYTVSFMTNGEIEHVEKVKANTKVKYYASTYYNDEYHEFVSWYLGSNEYDFDSLVNEDIILTSYFKTEKFIITFKNANGKVIKQEEVNGGEKIEAPKDPTLPSDSDYDYVFAGWDKDFDLATSDLEIVATYTKKVRTYQVAFYNYSYSDDIYEGGIAKVVDVTKGEKVPEFSVTRDTDDKFTYVFAGWQDQNGNFFDYNTPITKNTFLFPLFDGIVKESVSTEGLTFCILGDSVSTFYSTTSKVNSYYSGTNQFYYPIYSSTVTKAEQTWWYIASENMKTNIGINESLSGSSCYGGTSATQSTNRISHLGENGSPDIIIILIGANDNVNGHTLAQFTSAYRTMLSNIHKTYPDAYVFCVTWGYCAYSGYNYTEEDRLAYNNIIREMCAKDSAFLVDWATMQTEETYSLWLGDALHFNATGMKKLGDYVSDAIINSLKGE